MQRRVWIGALLVASACLGTTRAGAQVEPEGGRDEPEEALPPPEAPHTIDAEPERTAPVAETDEGEEVEALEDRDLEAIEEAEDDGLLGPEPELRWPDEYRRVHWAEVVAAPLLIGGAFTMLTVPDPPPDDFGPANSFDRELQEIFSVRNERYRDKIELLGQIGFFGSMTYRAFDDLIMAGAVRGGWDVAWQLAVIDAQAFGLVGTVVWGSQLLVGRQRPSAHFCENSNYPNYQNEVSCDPTSDRANRSFISGHFAVGVAGASLTCMHHARFPIYRGEWGKVACAAQSVMTGVVGVARTTGDHHWPTDMLMGGALGFVAGWVIPRALHYGFDDYGFDVDPSDDEEEQGESEFADRAPDHFRITGLPWFGRGHAGARVMGIF